MPFTPTDFADGSAGGTPITAAELDKLGTQYAQALADVPTASDTVAGKVELATAAEVQAGTDTTRAVTTAGLVSRTATETRAGVVELATTAEATTGTDTTRAVTPAGVKAVADTKAPTIHNHNASDINAGTLAVARLGSSGTPSATTFLRGDNTWATPAGGGGATLVGKAAWWTALPESATWVIPGEPGSVSGTINFSTGGGAIWLRPLDIGAASTLDAVGINVGTGSADGTGHFGIWASDADGMPTGLPVWSSAFDIVTAGNKIITVSPSVSIDASTRRWIGVLILGASAGTFRRHLATQAHGGDSFEHHGTDANAALGASANAIKFPLSHTTTASGINTDLTGATRTAQVGMPLIGANVTRL